MHYWIHSTPTSLCRHFENCVRQFLKTSWWKITLIGCWLFNINYYWIEMLLLFSWASRCLIFNYFLCAQNQIHPNPNKNSLSALQCWNELFELFDYSNSWDRIVVFGVRIRSFSGFQILFELYEYKVSQKKCTFVLGGHSTYKFWARIKSQGCFGILRFSAFQNCPYFWLLTQ